MHYPTRSKTENITIPLRDWKTILKDIDTGSVNQASKTTKSEKRALGQIFTPPQMAKKLVSLVSHFNNPNANYADPGTGTGILSATLLSRHAMESNEPPSSLTAYADSRLHDNWKDNFKEICYKMA